MSHVKWSPGEALGHVCRLSERNLSCRHRRPYRRASPAEMGQSDERDVGMEKQQIPDLGAAAAFVEDKAVEDMMIPGARG